MEQRKLVLLGYQWLAGIVRGRLYNTMTTEYKIKYLTKSVKEIQKAVEVLTTHCSMIVGDAGVEMIAKHLNEADFILLCVEDD